MRTIYDIQPKKLARFRGATYAELEEAENTLLEEAHDVAVIRRAMREEMRLTFQPRDFDIEDWRPEVNAKDDVRGHGH